MTRWIDIVEYRNFYDIPRMFVVVENGRTFLFDCPFDHVADEFTPHYNVYELMDVESDSLPKDWREFSKRLRRLVGRVAVNDVSFDDSERRRITLTGLEDCFG
jgi:hypothetical protein